MLKGQIENQLNTINALTGALLRQTFRGELESVAKKKKQNSTGKKPALQQPVSQDFYQSVPCREFCHGHGLLGDRPADC